MMKKFITGLLSIKAFIAGLILFAGINGIIEGIDRSSLSFTIISTCLMALFLLLVYTTPEDHAR